MLGDVVARGTRDVAVEDGDVVGVDAQQLQRGVAVTGDVGRDRFQPQPVADGLRHVGLVLDDQHTHAQTLTTRRISPVYRKPHTGWQRDAAFTDGMNYTAPARAASRLAYVLVLGGLTIAIVVLIGTLGQPSVSSSAPSLGDVLRIDDHGALGVADGVVTGGASVFDDELPAVANLDPSLLEALRRAAAEAARTASTPGQQRLAVTRLPGAAAP